MKNNQEFKLINGSFDKEEAKSLLTDLYSSKIKFHSIRALRHEELHASKSAYHQLKIEELKIERDRLIQFTNTLKQTDRVQISSHISIQINTDI